MKKLFAVAILAVTLFDVDKERQPVWEVDLV